MKTEREKMLAGELYNAGDAELCAARAVRDGSAGHSTQRRKRMEKRAMRFSGSCWARPGRISMWNLISNATMAATSMWVKTSMPTLTLSSSTAARCTSERIVCSPYAYASTLPRTRLIHMSAMKSAWNMENPSPLAITFGSAAARSLIPA